MEVIVRKFKNMMNVSMGMILIDLLVGGLLFFFTDMAVRVSLCLIGSMMVINGLFGMIKYFYDGLGSKIFKTKIISSVVNVVLGIFILIGKFEFFKVIGILVGIWFIIQGADKMFFGIKLLKNKDVIYPLIMFISIMTVVIGALIIFNPFKSFMIVTKMIGLFIAVEAVFELMACSLYKKRAKILLKIFE